MKLLSKILMAISLLMRLWSSSVEASNYPRLQQSLAVTALLTGGLGAGVTLVAWGIKESHGIKIFSGSCLLLATVVGSLLLICMPPHNWYGTLH